MGIIIKKFAAGHLTLTDAYLQVPKNQSVRLNDPLVKVNVYTSLDARTKGLPALMDLQIQLDPEVLESVAVIRATYDKLRETYAHADTKDHKTPLQRTELPKINRVIIEDGVLVAEGELTQSTDTLVLNTGEVITEGKKFSIKSLSRFVTLQVLREDELPSEVIYVKDFIKT